MNISLQAHEQLLFRHEVLRARLDIRDFFLKNTVREVYENIGQVLSLVRMQLAMLDDNKAEALETIESPGNLVGQSIRDLRIMCKSFYPDTDILNEEKFTEALKDTIKILFQFEEPVIKIKGIQHDIQADLTLIVFKMVQELLTLIKESGGTFVSLAIVCGEQKTKFKILYTGEILPLEKETTKDSIDLTLHERAQLIKGKLNFIKKENGLVEIRLSYPLNYTYD